MGRKASTINLSEDERLYLETQMRARTIQAQTVIRARILLLKAEGISANYAQTECQFRYCGTAIPFLTVRSTAR